MSPLGVVFKILLAVLVLNGKCDSYNSHTVNFAFYDLSRDLEKKFIKSEVKTEMITKKIHEDRN